MHYKNQTRFPYERCCYFVIHLLRKHRWFEYFQIMTHLFSIYMLTLLSFRGGQKSKKLKNVCDFLDFLIGSNRMMEKLFFRYSDAWENISNKSIVHKKQKNFTSVYDPWEQFSLIYVRRPVVLQLHPFCLSACHTRWVFVKIVFVVITPDKEPPLNDKIFNQALLLWESWGGGGG